MTITYTEPALDDLEQIEFYYSERVASETAERTVQRIKNALERLISQHSRVERLRPEFGKDTRSFPVLPYVVFYRTEKRRIIVERILHGRRDIHAPIMSLLVAV